MSSSSSFYYSAPPRLSSAFSRAPSKSLGESTLCRVRKMRYLVTQGRELHAKKDMLSREVCEARPKSSGCFCDKHQDEEGNEYLAPLFGKGRKVWSRNKGLAENLLEACRYVRKVINNMERKETTKNKETLLGTLYCEDSGKVRVYECSKEISSPGLPELVEGLEIAQPFAVVLPLSKLLESSKGIFAEIVL